jgi:hypothetical protein
MGSYVAGAKQDITLTLNGSCENTCFSGFGTAEIATPAGLDGYGTMIRSGNADAETNFSLYVVAFFRSTFTTRENEMYITSGVDILESFEAISKGPVSVPGSENATMEAGDAGWSDVRRHLRKYVAPIAGVIGKVATVAGNYSSDPRVKGAAMITGQVGNTISDLARNAGYKVTG